MKTSPKPPDEIELIIDKAEKDSPIYPDTIEWGDDRGWNKVIKVKKTSEKLKTGDIALRGYLDLSLIEWKRSLQEVRDNLFTQDKRRFGKCISRLTTECSIPYLFLDFHPGRSNVLGYGHQSPAQVWDAIHRMVHRQGLRLMTYYGQPTDASRRFLGEQAVRILWNHAWEHQCGIPFNERRDRCSTVLLQQPSLL